MPKGVASFPDLSENIQIGWLIYLLSFVRVAQLADTEKRSFSLIGITGGQKCLSGHRGDCREAAPNTVRVG